MIDFRCTSCGEIYHVGEELAGKATKCVRCDEPTRVPSPAVAALQAKEVARITAKPKPPYHLPNWVPITIGVLIMAAGVAVGLNVGGVLLFILGLVIFVARKPIPSKRCPQCDEKIRVNAKICKHCKSSVTG